MNTSERPVALGSVVLRSQRLRRHLGRWRAHGTTGQTMHCSYPFFGWWAEKIEHIRKRTEMVVGVRNAKKI